MERSRSGGLRSTVRRLRVAVATATVASTGLLAACGGADSTPPDEPSTTQTEKVSEAARAAWADDLEILDQTVRSRHPSPFWKTDEATWEARIDELESTLPTMTDEQARVEIMKLVALLDTHSGVFAEELGFHFYGMAVYEFSDGVFVVNATDPQLVGSRLTSVDGEPIDEVLDAVAPLVNGDNDSGIRYMRGWLTMCVECLHALGIVDDVRHPAFAFERPDGTSVTVDLPSLTVDELISRVYGDPVVPLWVADPSGVGPEAVLQLAKQVWWKVDRGSSAFVLSYNHVGADVAGALRAMRSAMKNGSAKRVVLDMRYATGGSWQGTWALRDALSTDPRLKGRGSLTVLIGRQNVSASTALASWLDVNTNATLVGEPTPSRPNPLLDETTVTLPNSVIIVHLPTTQVEITDQSDKRTAVSPDVPVDESSVDFFAGRDATLEVALGDPQ